jgi:hypothetical protein
LRQSFVVEEAEECRKVGRRGGLGVAFLEGRLDALEDGGGLNVVSRWTRIWEEKTESWAGETIE